MAIVLVPSHPLRFIIEFNVFLLLLIPAILWSGLCKIWPAKRKSVKGQVVLITGAARGLGRELAFRFSKLGAKIVCLDVLEDDNDETAKLIRDEGGEAVSYKCDVSNKDQIKSVHERVKQDLGPVDILINNAGIVWGHLYIDPTKSQFITDVINVNLMGQYWMNREFLPTMMERNHGHIVAMSSMSSMAGVPGINSYTVSKWATNGMMECLNNELKEFNSNVKTTTILPYFVETNPKVTAALDIRFPEIPIKAAGSAIVDGILKEKRIFSVPSHMMVVTSYIRLLPDNMISLFNKIFYVRVVEQETDKPIITKYKRLNKI